MNRREAITQTAWMLGGVLSAPTLQAMNRWEQISTNGPANNLTGSFLTETQRKIVARTTELIIPRTDTPGALDADSFPIDTMNLSIKAEKAQTYDAIVVGSGMTGGWAAKELQLALCNATN